jgi:hypothetical protein
MTVILASTKVVQDSRNLRPWGYSLAPSGLTGSAPPLRLALAWTPSFCIA